MQYPRLIFFEQNILADDTEPKDDIDRLFENLEQIEPPPGLIKKILKEIPSKSKLPLDLSSPIAEDALWGDLDSLIVRNEKRKPC